MKKIFALVGSVLLILGTLAYAVTVTQQNHIAQVQSVASQPAKIAVVNMEQVLMQSSRVVKANTALQQRFKPQQEKLAAEQKKLQEEMDAYDIAASKMSQKDRDTTEKKLADNKTAFLKTAEAFQKELNQEQNKTMQVILNRLNGIISTLAKKNGYTLVLDSQAVIYSNDVSDVTKQVATEFNKE